VTGFAKGALCAALMAALVPAAPAVAGAADNGSSSGIAALSRVVPRTAARAVLIDAASATLYMIENGRIVDSMKVIVGKPAEPTPELKTALTYAIVNPYWHVPPDIARTLTAPNVLKQGFSYLRDRGYEVVSSFGPDAQVLDPATVDWQAVADGRATVKVRQRPGPANSMGRIKFSLAAGDGIYLHDTPKKELFEQDERNLSAGCVRLEDAQRLARWLVGDQPLLAATTPEDRIAMPSYVPVTITYLDAAAQTQLAALR
jgi:murein L,D-transpeptidase YcbB/YkuD